MTSSAHARRTAHSLEELQEAEQRKGLLFVAVTSFGVYLATAVALRTITRKEHALGDARAAMLLAERRAMAGVFASAVAHDARNQLTVVRLQLEELADEARGADDSEGIASALSAVDTLERSLQMLIGSGKSSAGSAVERDVAEVTNEALSLVRAHAAVRRCALRTQLESVRCRLTPTLFHHIVVNLVINAAEAQDGHGVIEVHVRRENDHAVLEVHDGGPGLPASVRAKLFEPYQTTKPTGTGLGLWSVRECARLQDADVAPDASPLGGACLRVRLRC